MLTFSQICPLPRDPVRECQNHGKPFHCWGIWGHGRFHYKGKEQKEPVNIIDTIILKLKKCTKTRCLLLYEPKVAVLIQAEGEKKKHIPFIGLLHFPLGGPFLVIWLLLSWPFACAPELTRSTAHFCFCPSWIPRPS